MNPSTLVILAGNPQTDPDILDQLSRHPHPDVSWTASATLAGQPPGSHVGDLIVRARRADLFALDEQATPASPGTDEVASTSLTTNPDRLLERPTTDTTWRRRRRNALLFGTVALVIGAVLVLTMTFTQGNSTAPKFANPGEQTGPATSRHAATTTVTQTITSTLAPATSSPVIPPAPTGPATRPPETSPASQVFTISSASGRFCDKVQITVHVSPEPGSVTITDDSGTVVGALGGTSGQTGEFTLARPTGRLDVHVTSVGPSLSVSGQANGPSC